MKQDNELVSIIIPTYNRAGSIGRAIESALRQDYPSLEVIVVDDGSTDDTAEAVKVFESATVRYIHQENSGANVARNRGISEARGSYVALLDSDDTFLPGHIRRSVDFLKRNASSATFARIVVDRGQGATFLKPPRGPRAGEPISEYLSCDAGFIQTSTVVVPSAVAKSVKYLEWLPYGQDVDFAIRLEQAGCRWHMFETPGSIWNDMKSSQRISSKTDPTVRMKWANEQRHLLTNKAYHGFIGWRVAKAHAENGRVLKGLALWLGATSRAAYPPKHALVVFAQILLANGWYRRIADIRVKATARH